MEREESKSLLQYINHMPTLLDYSFKKSEPFAISHKSFLEIILEKIKYYQNLFLSEGNNLKIIKQCLSAFNNNLLIILKEKMNKQQYYEKEITFKKSQLQHKLYDKNTKDNQCNNYNSKDNISYINDNSKLNDKIINYINEKKLLENLSFKAENEINKIESDIWVRVNIIIILRTLRFHHKANLEIITDQKNLRSDANRILKKQLKSCRKILLKDINQKIENDKKANKIKEEIEYYKKKIKMKKKYITSGNIIGEDSIDNSQSIIINDNDNDNKPINENIIKQQEIENKYFYNNKKKFKYNRNNIDKINFNTNNNNMNEFKETINEKKIRSFSNKINNRINSQKIKDNCNLYIII